MMIEQHLGSLEGARWPKEHGVCVDKLCMKMSRFVSGQGSRV